jgi:hypothetical protein
MIGCNMQVADGYQHARLAGIGDGKKQAEKDHPEHYRRMLGLDPAYKKPPAEITGPKSQ